MDAGRSLSANNPSSYSLSVSESSDGDEPPLSYGANAPAVSVEPSARSNTFWGGLKHNLLFSWILPKRTVTYKHVSNNTSHGRSSIDSDISISSSSGALQQFTVDDGMPKRVTFTSTLRHIVLSSSWLNCLIVFVPVGAVSYLTNMPPALVFVTNAIAIVPLSALLTDATERIAKEAGDAVGALLNISLGNLVELIIFVALKNNHIRIVCASILGSVLVNLLLILGSALLACTVSGQQSTYSASGTQLLGSLLFVSVLAFLMPTAFDYTFQDVENSKGGNLKMSRVSSLIVLGIYMFYIFHELRSRRPSIGEGVPAQPDDEESSLSPSRSRSPSRSVSEREMTMRDDVEAFPGLQPRHVHFVDDSESDMSAVAASKAPVQITEENNASRNASDISNPEERGRRPRSKSKSNGSGYQQPSFTASSSRSRNRSHSGSAIGGRPSLEAAIGEGGRGVLMRSGRSTVRAMRTSLDEPHFPIDLLPPEDRSGPSALARRNKAMGMAVSILVLIVSSGLMSLNAEFLVSTIDDVTHSGGWLSESIIGLIILPIVGNMAEYITVVTVAMREKLDLAVAVSIGSSIQIALCVTPLTVLASWIMDREMILTFNYFEMSTLVGSVLLVNLIILGGGGEAADPAANSLKGGLMCGCYAMIAIGAYLSP